MAILQECRHRNAQQRGSLAPVTPTRPAVGVPAAWPSWCARPFRASACRCWNQLPGDHCLPRVSTGQPQHLCGEPLRPPTATAHAAHFASNILRLGPAAPIAVELNSHHELRDGCSPSTTAGEDLASTPGGMEIELSEDPAQATRISGGGVSFPQSTAQRVLRVSTVLPPVYMDSDQHLPSHTAGTEDGLSRQAGMVPRRKHVAVVLRDADCDASTTACGTPLATVTTWLEMRKCTVPRGSRDSPTGIWTDGMEQAECVSAAACLELMFSANGRSAIIPFAVFSPCR
ncbi:hypothetical protein TcBrA4_0021100 [Trypanosoma cruzi]|nr:hypothetical protein TcBrA4_0021100 [Trypanosoma cruzi]